MQNSISKVEPELGRMKEVILKDASIIFNKQGMTTLIRNNKNTH